MTRAKAATSTASKTASKATRPAQTGSQAASASDATANGEREGLRFEDALARLEGVVDRLEEGELDLEASLAVFEEGVRLSRRCAQQLDAAEQRVEVLVREAGSLTKRLFDVGDATEAETAEAETADAEAADGGTADAEAEDAETVDARGSG